MKISFQKLPGDASLGIVFFWKMTIDAKSSKTIRDNFIPELFFDYFFIKEGSIKCVDNAQDKEFTLPQETLKTIHTKPLTFVFSPRLVLYGARLSLSFAESFWGEMQADSFLKQAWVGGDAKSLTNFANQIAKRIQSHRRKKFPYPLFSKKLGESDWLVNYSPRHKRRLYSQAFGLSRKELLSISNVQSFLEQTCDFGSQNPRIIRHINSEVFYDQPHLNRSFKKLTGFSPLEYFEARSILQDNLMSASYNEENSQ